MRTISVRWLDLEKAFERNTPDSEAFLDAQTGEVLTISRGQADAAVLRARIFADAERFLRIEPAPSRMQFKWMECYIATIGDEALRDRLLLSLDGRGAFRRFKDVLADYPTEREQWFQFRGKRLHWQMQLWFEREQLAGSEPPPWGRLEEPDRADAPVERATLGVESPSQVLRRQAKDLVDQVPAIELSAAIAFLEFLRDRGVDELGRLPLSFIKRAG